MPFALRILVCGAVCVSLALRTASAPAVPGDDAQAAEQPKYDPISSYREETVEGWKVLIHRDMYAEPAESLREETLRLLSDHLYRIARAVPEKGLARLRDVPIWVERAHPLHPCMCYHVSPDWLREHDMNPEKAGAVEIANCENFLIWTHDQPWMVLHELAHAYHDQVLSYDHAGVREAFEKAGAAGLYESVLRIQGRSERHYALTNDKEYFAEATEAWFGTNDFFPFVRAELVRHDAEGAKLMKEVWGEPVRK